MRPTADQGARAGGRDAEHEADAQAEHHRGDLVAALHLDRVALALVHALEQRAHERRRAGEQQRDREDREQHVVEVASGPVLQQRQHVDSADGRGYRADRHPARELNVDRPLPPMLVAADRLRDRGVREVCADRRDRRDTEDENQHRRHERPAADAGHADEDAHAEAEADQRKIHRQNLAAGRDHLGAHAPRIHLTHGG